MPDRLVAKGIDYLTPWGIVNRLKSAFSYVEADGEEGRRHVLAMIKRLGSGAPGQHNDHQILVERLARVKNRALFICFGDDPGSERETLGMYVIPGMPLVFEYRSEEHEKAVHHLLTRCAAALDYELIKDRRIADTPGFGGLERRRFTGERRSFIERRLADRRSSAADYLQLQRLSRQISDGEARSTSGK